MRIIIYSIYLTHTQPLFIDLFLLLLVKLILNRMCIIIYKLCNGLLPEVINVLLLISSNVYYRIVFVSLNVIIMFTILDYSSALEYGIIRRYTNIVYYYYYVRNKDIHSYNTRSSNLLTVHKYSMHFVNISTRLGNVLLLNIDVNV